MARVYDDQAPAPPQVCPVRLRRWYGYAASALKSSGYLRLLAYTFSGVSEFTVRSLGQNAAVWAAASMFIYAFAAV